MSLCSRALVAPGSASIQEFIFFFFFSHLKCSSWPGILSVTLPRNSGGDGPGDARAEALPVIKAADPASNSHSANILSS